MRLHIKERLFLPAIFILTILYSDHEKAYSQSNNRRIRRQGKILSRTFRFSSRSVEWNRVQNERWSQSKEFDYEQVGTHRFCRQTQNGQEGTPFREGRILRQKGQVWLC